MASEPDEPNEWSVLDTYGDRLAAEADAGYLRSEMVAALRGVDLVVAQRNQDKMAMWEHLRFDRWVHGDDWRDDERFRRYRRELEAVGVDCLFLPYTPGVSSSSRRRALAMSHAALAS